MKPAQAVGIAAATLCAAALLLLLLSGPGTRFGAWHFSVGLGLLRWAVYLGAAGAVLALVALSAPKLRAGRTAVLVAALVAGLAAVAAPLRFQQLARAVPPIHDITTDLDDPPKFVAVLPLRAGAPNPAAHAGAAIADQQRQAYPDVQPLLLPVPVAEAFARAHRVAQALGWEIVAADAGAGRVEATATTAWFGFKDDIVVRVAPAGTSGTRVDIRSKSRVGRGDAGANAGRIREFLAAMGRA
jgi:uncharacterized protein (DUF1499 family)